MNLHDWIDELCDALDLETEVDEGLLADLIGLARANVEEAAGAVTAYLLGYAAGSTAAGPATIEQLAAKASELAEAWDRPVSEEDDDLDDVPDDLPDDLPDDESIADRADTGLDNDDSEDDDA